MIHSKVEGRFICPPGSAADAQTPIVLLNHTLYRTRNNNCEPCEWLMYVHVVVMSARRTVRAPDASAPAREVHPPRRTRTTRTRTSRAAQKDIRERDGLRGEQGTTAR